MPNAKPRYTGSGGSELTNDFSETLKETLRGYYPNQQAEADPAWGHPADTFVSDVLAEAHWAVSELHWQRLDVTKQEIRAERSDLLEALTDLSHKLRSLSPEFDRLLGFAAEPLRWADEIDEWIRNVEDAGQLIDTLPNAKKPMEKQHAVAVEMAIRVLRILKVYGIDPSATGGSYFDYTSNAVQILKAIGNDIGLVLADLTWRDKIIAAKKSAPDLD